jgi:hypothetical protein
VFEPGAARAHRTRSARLQGRRRAYFGGSGSPLVARCGRALLQRPPARPPADFQADLDDDAYAAWSRA